MATQVRKRKTASKKAAPVKKAVSKSRVVGGGKSKGKRAGGDSEYFNKLTTTPKGIMSYPVLHEPRTTQDDREQYSCDLYVSKEDLAGEKGQKFMSVYNEALDFYGIDEADLEYPPIIDMDEEEDCPEFAEGCYRIRAKNKLVKPAVVDRKKDELDEEDVAAIKGGDIGKLLVSPYKYVWQKKDGIGLALEAVMYIEEGEPLGGGSAARMSAIAEMDDEELDDEEFEESSEEVEAEEDDTEFDD